MSYGAQPGLPRHTRDTPEGLETKQASACAEGAINGGSCTKRGAARTWPTPLPSLLGLWSSLILVNIRGALLVLPCEVRVAEVCWEQRLCGGHGTAARASGERTKPVSGDSTGRESGVYPPSLRLLPSAPLEQARRRGPLGTSQRSPFST